MYFFYYMYDYSYYVYYKIAVFFRLYYLILCYDNMK